MSSSYIRPNIQLRTNVLCIRLGPDHAGTGHRKRSIEQLASRMTYFELVALAKASPLQFSWTLHRPEHLTPEQIVQRDSYLRQAGTTAFGDALRGLTPLAVALLEDKNSPGEDSGPEEEEDRLPDNTKNLIEEMAEDQELPPSPAVRPEEPKDPQLAVIEAGTDRSLLITAPPGTGKTYALIERLVWLLGNGKFENPAEELLVLSFSRAAVAEIRRRVAERTATGASDSLRYVTVRTFDSFAYHALTQQFSEQQIFRMSLGMGSDSYERSIRLLSRELDNPESEIRKAFRKILYLVVDEIQDLVCARAAMVLGLMSSVQAQGGHVMLLGDPGQAIYDYQVYQNGDPCPERLDSAKFFGQIVQKGGATLEKIRFNEFYRYEDERLRQFVRSAGEALGVDGAQPDAAELLNLLYGFHKPVELANLPALVGVEKKLAILVRTNAEARQLNRWCRDQPVPVPSRVHRGTRGELWPGEIARIFAGWEQESMRLDTLATRWERLIGRESGFSRDELLSLLESSQIARNGAINLRKLRRLVTTQAPPIASAQEEGLVISTIHRSKGLEFNSVLVLEPDQRGETDAEELRVVYVAATRAKRRLSILRRDNRVFLHPRRIGRTPYFRVGSQLFLNMDGDLDSDLLDAELGTPSGPLAVQQALWQHWEASSFGSFRLFFRKRTNDAGRVNFSLAIRMAKGELEDICWCSGPLNNALFGSVGRIADLAPGEQGWEVRATGLSTIAFDTGHNHATELFGEAGVALVPVLDSSVFLESTVGMEGK